MPEDLQISPEQRVCAVREILSACSEPPAAMVRSFGCQLNVADGEKLKGTLKDGELTLKQDGEELIFRKAGADMGSMGERMIRIVFEGNASTDPVIASLVMECHVAVNIMYADTRDVNGKAFGQMILQLPEDKLQQEKAIYYLQSKGLHVEEVSGHGA